MGLLTNIADYVLHLDRYLGLIIGRFGALTYLLLFIIIFCETGLVFTPFLPGDSLLFVAGTFAANGVMSIWLLFGLLGAAAFLGDTVNYWIGKLFGERVLERSRLVKKDYIDRTKQFYQKYGAKTIILARFVPIIRTMAPFVAGIGRMSYLEFISFNIIGGVTWVALFLFSGYFFGGIPIIKDNLTYVILVIIAISMIPPLLEAIKAKRQGHKV